MGAVHILGPLVLSAIATLSPTQTLASDCAADRVDLRGDWGQAQFSVEIADDTQERAQGLMHRESLPRRAGMLFLYETPHHASFWMKNTLIPLDMLFLDSAGRVTQIAQNAAPHDLSGQDGGEGVLAVLEINGGLSALYGITEGSELRHPFFKNTTAAWPCGDGSDD